MIPTKDRRAPLFSDTLYLKGFCFCSPVMAVMKQKNLRQAEKTLREMLDRADTGGEGKVELAEFIKILEANNVQVVI